MANKTETIDEFEYITDEQSLTEKDWAAGSKEQTEFTELIICASGEVDYKKIVYSPQMTKMFDEVIVNTLDHAYKQQDKIKLGENVNPVKYISMQYNDDGSAVIMNDGDGIRAVLHNGATKKLGKPTYTTSLMFATLFQGTNLKPTQPVGGTNGIGAKITNFLSNTFELETIRDGKKCYQVWKDRNAIESPPVITNTKVKPYTKISFMPDYSHFGYTAETLKDAMPTLHDIIFTRMCMVSAFCKFYLPSVVVKYNGEILKWSLEMIAKKLYPDAVIMRNVIQSEYPYEVIVVCAPNKHNHISNINGIVVIDGTHFTKVIKQISASVKTKVGKSLNNDETKLPANFVKNNVFMMINMQMIAPSWMGQRKDILCSSADKLAKLVLPDKTINAITAQLSILATEGIISRVKTIKAPEYEKYTKAKFAGTKQALKCRLIPCEGDSAKNQMEIGVASSIGFDYYGLISMGGVIMNANKQTTEHILAEDIKLIQSKKLKKNLFINAFISIMGLNYAYKYDKTSPTYAKEMSQLKYGGVICAVDQDMDGRGNILPLLLALFETYWINLLTDGFVEQFCTDVIRLFPKTKGVVYAFWDEADYEVKAKTMDLTKYNKKFYKGLGSHTKDETIRMFKNFNDRLRQFTTDERTHEVFNIYYGKEPKLRKIELCKPIRVLSPEIVEQELKTRIRSATVQLEIEARAFQTNNLEQKLDHFVDGQNQSSRKILHGAIVYFSKNMNSSVKVYQLGGGVSESQNYHHGDASLCASIKNRAFIDVGGVQVPIFQPHGQFGTRNNTKSASERYVETNLTNIVDILFNPNDYYLLDFNFEGEKRVEPKYFIPIIPLAILESKELPAHGWKLQLWARDAFQVIDVVKTMIDANIRIPTLNPTRYFGNYVWNGEFRNIRGRPFTVGKYLRYNIANGRTLIRITELPLRTWTNKYVKYLNKLCEKHDFIESVDDNHAPIGVSIDIILTSINAIADAGDSIWTDDIEEFFGLRVSMSSNINLTSIDGTVCEYSRYEDILRDWFPIRKAHYEKRILRQIEILNIKMEIREFIIKYILANYTLRGMERKDMDTFLENAGFPRAKAENLGSFKITAVETPLKFAKTEEIRGLIYNTTASYRYLLDISDSAKSAESLRKHREKLANLTTKRDKMLLENETDAFIGASAWKRELDELVIAMNAGINTNWLYEEVGKFTYE
jgi:DNA topoisomerase-2